MNNEMKTVFVLVKNSREYSSGQLEHLASYYDTEAEAEAARDQANAAELTKYADGLGKSEEAVADDFSAPWLVVEEDSDAD